MKHLTFGNVYRDTGRLFKECFVKLFLVMLVYTIIPAAISGLSVASMGNPELTAGFSGIIFVVNILYTIIGAPVMLFIVLNILNNANEGKTESVKALFSDGFNKIASYWGYSILVILIALGIFIPSMIVYSINLVAGSVVMIITYVVLFWIIIGLSMAYIKIMVEDNKAVESMKSSWELTKKKRGKIFLIYFVTILLFTIIATIAVMLGFGASQITDLLATDMTDPMAIVNLMTSMAPATLVFTILGIVIYPFFYSLYFAIYANLKKDKGEVVGSDDVNEFMENSEEEEYNPDNQ